MKNLMETAFTLESFVAWLEKQPPTKTYDYGDIYNCLLCQYFHSTGFTNACGGTIRGIRLFGYDDSKQNDGDTYNHGDYMKMHHISAGEADDIRYRDDKWNIEAALGRARMTLAEKQSS